MRCHPLFILLWVFCLLCAVPCAYADDAIGDVRACQQACEHKIVDNHKSIDSYDANHFLFKRWMFGGHFSFSILTDNMDSSFFAETLAGSVTIGYGVSPNLTFQVRFEQNGWHSEEYSNKWYSGVFNIGLGVDYQVFAPHVHFTAFLGPCILTYNTELAKAGKAGIFFELSPVDLHWDFANHWKLIVSILSLHVDIPVVHEPALKYIQYRTTVGFAYVL